MAWMSAKDKQVSSLTRVSRTMLEKYSRECREMGIQLGIPTDETYIAAEFPPGWRCEHVDPEDRRHARYWDPNGVPCFNVHFSNIGDEYVSNYAYHIDENFAMIIIAERDGTLSPTWHSVAW